MFYCKGSNKKGETEEELSYFWVFVKKDNHL